MSRGNEGSITVLVYLFPDANLARAEKVLRQFEVEVPRRQLRKARRGKDASKTQQKAAKPIEVEVADQAQRVQLTRSLDSKKVGYTRSSKKAA